MERRLTSLANVVLGGAGVCAVVVLAYLLHRYSWAQQGTFTSFGGVLLYFGLPALVAAGCFGLLWLRPGRRVNAALLIVSTGVSLYLGEIALSVWLSLPSVKVEQFARRRETAAKAAGVPFDNRTPLEVASALREQGIDAYPTGTRQDFLEQDDDGAVRPRTSIGTELLPLGWISNKASVACNESGEFVVYDSDEHGFHNPRGIWTGPPIEIVALGDSYTNGFCVPSDKNFVALIREQYPGTLNLGMPGHGPLAILATLKEYGPLVRPRVVLWFHFEGNDLSNLVYERKSPELMRYLEPSHTKDLAKRQAEVDRVLIGYVNELATTSTIARRLGELGDLLANPEELRGKTPNIIKLSHVRQQLGLVYGTAADPPERIQKDRRFTAEVALLSEILLEANRVAGTWDGTLYFVYLPHYPRYTTPAVSGGYWGRDSVLQTVQRLGLPLVDIHETFATHEDPLSLFPFRQSNHYNEMGHRLVAERVLRSVDIP